MKRVERDGERIGFAGIDEKQETGELDLLPEFCQYRDEGCDLSRSCLECPFPDCIEGQFRGCLKQARTLRDREIVRLKIAENISIKELSARFSVCTRTVLRALASRRKKNERERCFKSDKGKG